MCTATMTARTLVGRRSDLRGFKFESLVFVAAMLFVGAVSVYDGYLVLRTGDEIRHFEKNPVGLFLIEHSHGDPTVFLMAKALGTVVVLAALTMLYRRSQRIALSVASALMLFQAGLLVFLERAGG
jgi:hypothetical protein